MYSRESMVVSDDLATQQMLARALGRWGRAPIIALTIQEAAGILKHQQISLIFCSDELPDGRVEDFMQRASRHYQVPVVVVSRLSDWGSHIRFLQAGALDFLLCPSNSDEVDRLVRTVLFADDLEKLKNTQAVA